MGEQSAPDLPGLGPYRFVEKLGTGGMGVVYLAVVEGEAPGLEPGDRVAVKLVHPHLAERPEFLERSRREAEAGLRIRHENVVRTFDSCVHEVDGTPRHALVMEYVEGRTLGQLLVDLGPLPEAMLREIAIQTAEGLAAIHAGGIVHRDLKPDNLMITKDDQIRIMDLGVARFVEESMVLTTEGDFIGSFLYGAPEQFLGRTVGPAADLYSLGVTLHVMATGENPFLREHVAAVIAAHLEVVPKSLHEHDEEISAFFSEVVSSLLVKDPAARLASAPQVAALVRQGEASSWWTARQAEARNARSRLPSIPLRRETVLHGREAERDVLLQAWTRAREGDGNTLLLDGEAGIGKSRLVDAFLKDLPAGQAHVLYGSYPPSGGLGGLSDAVLTHFGAADLEFQLRPYLRATPALVPAFAALLKHEGLPGGSAGIPGDALHGLFCQLLHGLGDRHPTVWVVEDIHFAPVDSLSIVLSLARAVAGRRILLVVTSRSDLPGDVGPYLTRLRNLKRLSLSRLENEDVSRIVRDALLSDTLADRFGEHVVAKSDGVPFFVFEMIRTLKEDGYLQRDPSGAWVDSGSGRKLEVPSAIRELIRARLGNITSEERAILDLGAVQGFEFDPDLLARVLERGKVAVLRELVAIERRHGVVQSAGDHYRFDHHQMQEVIYEELPESLRAEYHAALAEARAERDGAGEIAAEEVPEETALFLCRHHLLGRRPGSGLPYMHRALDHLESSHRNDDALKLADLALAVSGLLSGAARARVLHRKAKRLNLLGRRAEEREALEEARQLSDEGGDDELVCRILTSLGANLHLAGEFDRALEIYREELGRARSMGDRELEGALLGSIGNVEADQGRLDEARARHEASLAIAVEIGDRRGEARARGNLAVDAFERHRFEEAIAGYEACREIFRELGDRRNEAIAINGIGLVFHNQRRDDEARELFTRHLEICREIGYRRGEAMALGNLGLVAMHQARLGEALQTLRRDLEIQQEIGDPGQEGVARTQLATVLAYLGDFEEAREHAEHASETLEEIGFVWGEAHARAVFAWIVEQCGRVAEAQALYECALELERRLSSDEGIADAQLNLGELLRKRGEEQRGRALIEEALLLATRSEARRLMLKARVALAVSAEDVGEVRAQLEMYAGELSPKERMEFRERLWRVSGDACDLDEAHRLLSVLVEGAPADRREAMVENVPLHARIRDAWEAGRT